MAVSAVNEPLPNQDSENSQQPSSKMDTCLKEKPFQLVKPLVVSMSLFGLLFFKCKRSKLSSITRAYSLFVILLFAVRFILLFFAYRHEHFGTQSVLKLVIHLWFLFNCLNAMITYKACDDENRFVEFLLKWSRLLRTNRGISPHDNNINTTDYESRLKRSFTIILAVGWIVVFINVAYNVYFLFNTNVKDFIIAPMAPGHSFAVPMKIITVIVHVYMSVSWVFTLTMSKIMSGVIYKEFEIFHDDLRQAISQDGDIDELEWFRRRHEDICQMLETADDTLSAFNAAGIFFSTCDAMLLLYNTVTSPNLSADPVLLLAYCFLLVTTCLYLVLISYGGGYLNHMAHAPLKTLHTIRVTDASPEFSLQMTMFLSKLTGEPIGFTALDMFVIDKPTILTIAGAFTTYFIVLIQFHQSSAAADPTVCNCTEFVG